jgi:HAD superfamily hydrolase (TIGR01509 family)
MRHKDAGECPADGLILDMDGVIANSEPLHAQAWVDALREFGIQTTIRWFDRWIGISDTKASQELVEHFDLPISPSQLMERRQQVFHEIIESDLVPIEGLDALLDRLALPTAVATSSYRDDVLRMLRKLDLLKRLPILVTREDVVNPKPNPEVYLEAADRLGVPADRCVAVEDSPAGVKAARGAGCYVLAVCTTHRETQLAGADRVFGGTVEALCWLAELTYRPTSSSR